MDIRSAVAFAAAATVFSSFLTILALNWWPAWVLLAALWFVSLLVILYQRPSDETLGKTADLA